MMTCLEVQSLQVPLDVALLSSTMAACDVGGCLAAQVAKRQQQD